MKNKLSLLIVLCICVMQTAFAREDVSVLSDGGASIGGNIGEAIAGVYVTLEILDSTDNMLNEEKWIIDPTSGVKYVDIAETNEKGDYTFDFYLDKSGKYTGMISYGDVAESFSFIYTNKSENGEVIEEIKAAESADKVYEILKRNDSAAKLMIADSEIYTSVSAEDEALLNVAGIIYEAKSDMKDNTPDEFAVNLQKAALIVALNDNEVSDIKQYYDILGTKELGIDGYYMEEKSKYITELIIEESPDSIADFNEILRDCVIRTNVRYSDDIDNTAKMLKAFADEIGILEKDITNACVRNMLGETFNSLDGINKFIKDYNKTNKPSSGGGSGSASGGGGGRGGSPQISIGDKQFAEEYENPPGTTEGILPFEDIDGVEWALPAINALYVKGIISGKSYSEFCPDDFVTREEFVKMLVTALSLDIIGTGMQFDDVGESDWYYEYVRSAYYADIVKGISETMFGAGQNVTRQDIAVMGCRALDVSGIEITEKNSGFEFVDANEIADYAEDAVSSMQKAGILNGDDTGCFNPTDFATRAEAAKIIYGIYQLL